MFFRRRVPLNAFGQKPDVEYYHGDMAYIRSRYDAWEKANPGAPSIDDVTWNDLDMDRVFRRINRGVSVSGEQLLYHMLRTPALDEKTWTERRRLVALMEDETARAGASGILARLGCVRRAGPCVPLGPQNGGTARLLLCAALALLLPASVLLASFLGETAVLAILGVVIVNSMTHEFLKRRLAGELDAVNYMVSLARATRRFQKLRDARLDACLAPAYEALGRMGAVLRIGMAAPAEIDGNLPDLLLTVTLLDLIAFERLKRIFLTRHEDVLILHDALGSLDAAVSIASWRRTVPEWTEPVLDFDPDAPRAVRAEAAVHPLLDHPVPNDLCIARPQLITGSNASGKSTYLRTAALCVLLAQSVCTCPARSYRAPVFRLFTSMTLSDDLLAGESYYVAEMHALKRILDALNDGAPVLCAVDEVLRGTNTVERIAASSQILDALDRAGALCLAATHDIELCDLLGERYENMHFEERIEEGRMLFDYRIRPGKATTRNAINLLELIGLDGRLIRDAHARAERYLETGLWT